MAGKFKRSAAALSVIAALSMAATPALARDRNWGGGGWGGGYHHRDRVDVGDVLAGVLIIGGIAAIAGAASKASKERRSYPQPPYPRQGDDRRWDDHSDDRYSSDGRYSSDDNREEWRGDDARSGNERDLTGAVDNCVAEVERTNRNIESVDSAERDGDGWRVEGKLRGGETFACTADADGRIRDVNL